MAGLDDSLTFLLVDERFVVVTKPAGLVVHPTYKNQSGTLLDQLRGRVSAAPSIVGRLDRMTSGLVVVALDGAAHAALQRAMAAGDCCKEYLAIVHGLVVSSGAIDLRIRVDERDRRRVVASEEAGSPSRTQYEPIAAATTDAGILSLLKCRPATGRRHQIRAHLSASGWPIVGDPVYGPGIAAASCDRLALHAWRLSLTSPFSGDRVQVTAPVPGDLEPIIRLVAPEAAA